MVGLEEVNSDARVVADLNVLSPMARLGFARIRMFAHIVDRRQTTLLTLLLATKSGTRSWLGAVQADMAWASAGSGKLTELRHETLQQWVAFFVSNGPKALCIVSCHGGLLQAGGRR